MMYYHNCIRKECGVPDLEWSPDLEYYAQAYAEQLVDIYPNQGNVSLHHVNGHHSYRDMDAGENIFYIKHRSGEKVGVTENEANTLAINAWAVEGWDGTISGRSGSSDHFAGLNHYTTMIWKDTRYVGCGVAKKGDQSFVICNYSHEPPNNSAGIDRNLKCQKRMKLPFEIDLI